jgi:hypothetical protein
MFVQVVGLETLMLDVSSAHLSYVKVHTDLPIIESWIKW